jgi:hypothetical protein
MVRVDERLPLGFDSEELCDEASSAGATSMRRSASSL